MSVKATTNRINAEELAAIQIKPMLDLYEVGVLLGVKKRTVENWVATGQLPTLLVMGHTRRVQRSKLDELIASWEAPAPGRKTPQSAKTTAPLRKVA
jgi:excisionase family DNA binding protein